MRPALIALLALLTLFAARLPAAEPYRLGPGDVVKITVYDHPELTTETRVSERRTVAFPLLGEVAVDRATAIELANRIAQDLQAGGFLKQAQVNVIVLEFSSEQVSVLGQVGKPGRYALTRESGVVDLLAVAGGVNPTAADEVVLLRPGEGGYTRTSINLNALLRRGEADLDRVLQGGDVLYVPRAPQFYIYGEVQRPGQYRLEEDMSVLQALSVAGGLTPRGTERGVKVKRRDRAGQTQTLRPGLDERLRADDVVFVKESLF